MKKKIKAWAMVGSNGDLHEQWNSSKGVFTKKIYGTAETARNQLYKTNPEINASIVPCTITYEI